MPARERAGDPAASSVRLARPARIVADRAGRAAPPLAAPHQKEEPRKDQDGADPAQTNQVHHDGAVLPDFRIVVVAVQKDLVDRVADFPIGGFDEPETEVARRVLDPVEVAGEPAVRSQDEDAARVRELTEVLVPAVAEADGLREPRDGAGPAGQEMPPLRGTRPAVLRQGRPLLC